MVSRLALRRPRVVWWAVWFMAPASVLFGALVLVPVVVAVWLSFVRWNGVGAAHFVGLGNWSELFSDPTAGASLERTGILVGASWVLQEPIAIAVGIYIAGRQRHRAVLSALYFLPLLISGAGIGIMWQNMLSPIGGGVQYIGMHVNFLSFLNKNWLGDPNLVLGTVVVLVAWEFIPFHMLLYQAGTRGIPNVLYEAAALDGISPFQKLRYITLPMLRNTIVTSSTLNIVGSLTIFDIIYTLTQGGPGESTRVFALDQYIVGFSEMNFGYGSALAVALGVLGIVISLIIIKVTGFGRMRSQAEGL
jgi:raffinose/stachyose/melibiose transport system permease protein